MSRNCPNPPETAMLRTVSSVAGVSAPAFVERAGQDTIKHLFAEVSLGFQPQPSLSGVVEWELVAHPVMCRWGFSPSLR